MDRRDFLKKAPAIVQGSLLLMLAVVVAAIASPRTDTALAAPFNLSGCAWPLKTTGTGLTNVAYPDTNATYWSMPLDRTRWQSMVVVGKYPESRFFSFVSYTGDGQAVDDIVDVDIAPNSNSTNPFVRGNTGPHYVYTVTIGGDTSGPNNVTLDDFDPANPLAWVIYRIYVQDEGLARNAGVPLPKITLVGYDGQRRQLLPCSSTAAVSQRDDAQYPLELKPLLQRLQQGVAHAASPSCQPQDNVVFWIPENSGGYFSNPANKYIAAPDLCFDRNKVVVVRGKAAGFPDTHSGEPVWKRAIAGVPIQLRYWSMCNNDEVTPYPVVECLADWATSLDDNGMYTYVIAAAELGKQPEWLPPGVNWLPWGLKSVANILLFRHMLPSDQFKHSVQYAESKGCTALNDPDNPPSREEVVAAGKCAEKYMGEYYPQAVYCAKQVLANLGWQGCFAASDQKDRLPGHVRR